MAVLVNGPRPYTPLGTLPALAPVAAAPARAYLPNAIPADPDRPLASPTACDYCAARLTTVNDHLVTVCPESILRAARRGVIGPEQPGKHIFDLSAEDRAMLEERVASWPGIRMAVS
jgi:hypothetical protein